mgnify:CR=1 FL=1
MRKLLILLVLGILVLSTFVQAVSLNLGNILGKLFSVLPLMTNEELNKVVRGCQGQVFFNGTGTEELDDYIGSNEGGLMYLLNPYHVNNSHIIKCAGL